MTKAEKQVIEKKPFYRSICQRCVYDTHPEMLTGYCITDSVCERCKQVTDLAMVKVK